MFDKDKQFFVVTTTIVCSNFFQSILVYFSGMTLKGIENILFEITFARIY